MLVPLYGKGGEGVGVSHSARKLAVLHVAVSLREPRQGSCMSHGKEARVKATRPVTGVARPVTGVTRPVTGRISKYSSPYSHLHQPLKMRGHSARGGGRSARDGAYFKILFALFPLTSTLEDASKTRSVRNAVRECTQTYMTERNRKHDAVLRRIFEGKRR